MVRITLGSQLHDLYIHSIDSNLIEEFVQLQPDDETNMTTQSDYIQYRVSATDVFPRYQEGEQIEYLFEVSADGYVTNIMYIIMNRPRVVHIDTPRKKTDFDRAKVEYIRILKNRFNLQRNQTGVDQMYIKSNTRSYKFKYDDKEWVIEFNNLHGNPYKFIDDKNMLYFTDPPKSQCIIYGPYDISFPTVKKLIQAIIPSIYKIKN